jgi:hypothetical protein
MGGLTGGRGKKLLATDQDVSHVRSYALLLILSVQLRSFKVYQNAGDESSGGENKGTLDQSVSKTCRLNEEGSCNPDLAADTAGEKEHVVVEGTETAIEIRETM